MNAPMGLQLEIQVILKLIREHKRGEYLKKCYDGHKAMIKSVTQSNPFTIVYSGMYMCINLIQVQKSLILYIYGLMGFIIQNI